MAFRPWHRRLGPDDLEAARKMVSRAERRALENAEQHRAEAEQALRAVSSRAVDAEAKVRAEFAAQLEALRCEMESVSTRATIAENELRLVREQNAELRSLVADSPLGPGAEGSSVPPLGTVALPDVGSGEASVEDEERLTEAARVSAERMHSQAALVLAQARQEAVGVLAAAARESEDLLRAAIEAIEHDMALSASAREDARRDADEAAALRTDVEAVFSEMEIVLGELLDTARHEADRIVDEARADARREFASVRRRLADEITGLVASMNRARDTFEQFLLVEPLDVPGVTAPAACVGEVEIRDRSA